MVNHSAILLLMIMGTVAGICADAADVCPVVYGLLMFEESDAAALCL